MYIDREVHMFRSTKSKQNTSLWMIRFDYTERIREREREIQ